jgi:hypothetical protein
MKNELLFVLKMIAPIPSHSISYVDGLAFKISVRTVPVVILGISFRR